MQDGQHLNRALRDAVDDSVVPINDFPDGLLAQLRDDTTGQGKRRQAVCCFDHGDWKASGTRIRLVPCAFRPLKPRSGAGPRPCGAPAEARPKWALVLSRLGEPETLPTGQWSISLWAVSVTVVPNVTAPTLLQETVKVVKRGSLVSTDQ